MLLEGESLFNDATAIVLFSLFLSMATATTGVVSVDDMRSLADIIVRFAIIFGGGALTGLIVGLRGAVTLALSLPTSLDYWWTIQSIAFGVVTFSLFVQAPTMQLLVKKLSFK